MGVGVAKIFLWIGWQNIFGDGLAIYIVVELGWQSLGVGW